MILIKYIGIAVAVLGLTSLALVIMSGRRNNIPGVKAELDMITGAGYATTHTAQRQTRSVLETTPVKVPPRRRALSREAADILKKVEEERAAERNDLQQKSEKRMKQPARERKGTAVLGENKRPAKGTVVLEAADKKPAKGTDVLPQKSSRSDTSGTDILTPPKREASPKGTDILGDPKKKASVGADVLTLQDKTTRNAGKGTAVLGAASNSEKGTAVLPQGKGERKGTDVLAPQRSGGTDVLPEPRKAKKQGTAVLMTESSLPGQRQEDTTPRSRTPKKKKGGSGTAVLQEAKRSGTGVLSQKGTAVLSERKEG